MNFFFPVIVLFWLLLASLNTARANGDGVDDHPYAGFHIGTVSGGGLVLNGGDLDHPAHLSFNLEFGYDFDNQIDIVGRIGYSPIFSAPDANIGGVVVPLPELFNMTNYDFGIRYVPFSARFSPYAVQLLGAYTSRSSSNGEQVFASQTGFHEVSGIGLQYRTGKRHLIGLEMATQFFLNDASNVTTLDFSLVYRITF